MVIISRCGALSAQLGWHGSLGKVGPSSPTHARLPARIAVLKPSRRVCTSASLFGSFEVGDEAESQIARPGAAAVASAIDDFKAHNTRLPCRPSSMCAKEKTRESEREI